MGWLELTAVLFSVACVLLGMYKNVWTWVVGIVGIVAYFIIFYQARLYGDMCLQLVFLAQSLYGWWFWQLRGAFSNPNQTQLATVATEQSDDFIVYSLSGAGWGLTALGLLGCFGLSAYLLSLTAADLPYLDAAASSISLVANLLLARKVLENWLLWVGADALLVYIFWQKGLYPSAATYLFFLVLAIFAYFKWRKNINVG